MPRLLRRWVAVAAVLIAVAAVSTSAQPENCKSPDGKYDLTPIAGTDISGTDNTYNYKLQVCGVAFETSCAQNGGSFCQYSLQNAYSHVLTKWDSTGQWSDCPASTCPNGGLQVYFANGDKCNGGSGPPRAVTYIFNCPAAGQPSSTSYTVGSQGCIFTVTMTHSVGCGANPQPTECKSPDGNWDLSPLAGADLPGADSTYSYFLHPCGVANETVCAGTGGSFCQYTHSMPSTFMHTLARWDRTGYWTQCSAADCPYGGVQIWYQNGDRCGGSGPYRDVTFTFACPAPGQASSTAYTVVTSGCEYAVSMVNKVGCGNNSTRLLATAAAADAEAKADAAEAEANAKPADDESQPW